MSNFRKWSGKRKRKIMHVLSRDKGWKCSYCGTDLPPATPELYKKWNVEQWKKFPTIDHIIAISKGGSNKIENLTLCCAWCNTKKRDRLPQVNQAKESRVDSNPF